MPRRRGRVLGDSLGALAVLLAITAATAARADPSTSQGWLVWLTQQSLRGRDDALLVLGLLGLLGGAVTLIVLAAALLMSWRQTRVDPPQCEPGSRGVTSSGGPRDARAPHG